jgi:DNA mismatch repair protein MutS2
MKHFDHQSVLDLEFDAIRLLVHDYCHSESAQLEAVDLNPIVYEHQLHTELKRAKEFQTIRSESLDLPRIEFEELQDIVHLLGKRNAMLSIQGFANVLRASRLVNDILSFFKSRKSDDFPTLRELLVDVYEEKAIIKAIEKVLDDKGEVRDSASPELAKIRQEMATVKKTISRNFNKVLKEYKQRGWLSDTNEAFVQERRVLSVKSSFKRQIPGHVLGTSKTGNWSYIEPELNQPLNYELEQLRDDEQNEIRRILVELTAFVAQYRPLISAYQELLVRFDLLNAKTRLALQLDADLPGLSDEMCIELIKAYHPLLLLANRKAGLKTKPQSLSMDKFSRILVISGPNAGGKSITLKTVGLLQVMLQSGLLVPVDPNSTMSFFQAVLTDIGDNQSIENQLSTYSYRLKRMKHFLEVANKRTLLLLDEFGTGSDPDLGGALAEVFFERLYSKKCFGVITTHYANIKLKASQLRNAINGCMLFDSESLEPLFMLSIGQPGSSFTFEVAVINGIDPELIAEAKLKLDDRKVNLDEMIANLQSEKSQIERLNNDLREAQSRAKKSEESFESKRKKFEERLLKQEELIEKNNQYIGKGKKLDQFIKLYKTSGGNRPLLDDVRTYLAMEKTKTEEARKKLQIKESAKKKRNESQERKSNAARIVVGCTVKLRNAREKGTVLELSNGQAVVAFGVFKTKVEVAKLDFVRAR